MLSSCFFYIRCLIGSLFLFSSLGKTQQIVLLDRSFLHSATYTDSLTLASFTKNIFPVYVSDVQPVIEAVEEVGKKINQSRYHRAGAYKIPVGHSQIILHVAIHKQIKKYLFILGTEANGFTTYIELVRGDYDRSAQQKVIGFLEYLRNNVYLVNHDLPKGR